MPPERNQWRRQLRDRGPWPGGAGTTFLALDGPEAVQTEVPLSVAERGGWKCPADPGANCPDCGGELRVAGEDVRERIGMIAAKLKVIEIARIRKSCRRCARMVQCAPVCAIGASTMAGAPSRPIPRRMAGPNLLAYVLTSRFDGRMPLYRQNEIFARMGADIPDTTLADWCGGAMKTLAPPIEAGIMASDLLPADDTPIRVLDRSRKDWGLGKGVKQGRIRVYVRDRPPWAGQAPPGAVYSFLPGRKGGHPRKHLARSSATLQADAYTAFKELYERRADGTAQFHEAACWAHLRRDFHHVRTSDKSGIAKEAPDRIGKLYDIERQIAGQPAEVRRAIRQDKGKSKLEAFRARAEKQRTRIPGKSDPAKAFRSGLSRWESFCLFLDDGRVAIENNAAGRGMRPRSSRC